MVHPYSDIAELSGDAFSSGVVRIPVEQDIPFTPRVRAIVDTPQFQRLRQITQLALTSRVYPGAVHTRFEHALGVYHNALQYLWQLGKDERFADVVSVHDVEVLIVSALLHDIGHWPFCHPIEDLALPNMPPHESFAAEFLTADTELSDVLISQWKVQPDEVLQTLTGRSSDSSLQLRQSILSGPVDIDKMDYLNRDSQHCGVPYGRNFDRQRLISSLIVNESGDGLAITAKGRTAAEMMVFARYVMFSEVYWHHAVRAATSMFARCFYELHRQLDLPQLFAATDAEMIAALRQ
ncbi:MAG: HD domain-containing protein, partial [Planctomycetaceae bacterium]|nr:HD domain-containing protein [Planctomycetaceae bacterium]